MEHPTLITEWKSNMDEASYKAQSEKRKKTSEKIYGYFSRYYWLESIKKELCGSYFMMF